MRRLEAEGLVAPTAGEVQPRGRPVHRWKLTAGGHHRFPDAHAQITSELIASVRDVYGDDALERIIDRRTEDTLAHYHEAMAGCDTLEGKVRALCRLRSDEGYMAEYEKLEDGFVLKENHCPICVAAQSCQGFCRSELEVFKSLLEPSATVVREDHLLAGARRCTYRIVPRGGDRG